MDNEHFSFLVLAWTFVLSSRWVEILKPAGEQACMTFSKEGSMKDFWRLVARQQWQAIIIRGE